MGLKGYRLWVMGQLDSNVQRPTSGPEVRFPEARRELHLAVAVQVAFDPESKGLKPGFHLIGARVETTWVPGAFQLRVRGSQRVDIQNVGV
jgi:hypothetical protein